RRRPAISVWVAWAANTVCRAMNVWVVVGSPATVVWVACICAVAVAAAFGVFACCGAEGHGSFLHAGMMIKNTITDERKTAVIFFISKPPFSFLSCGIQYNIIIL